MTAIFWKCVDIKPLQRTPGFLLDSSIEKCKIWLKPKSATPHKKSCRCRTTTYCTTMHILLVDHFYCKSPANAHTIKCLQACSTTTCGGQRSTIPQVDRTTIPHRFSWSPHPLQIDTNWMLWHRPIYAGNRTARPHRRNIATHYMCASVSDWLKKARGGEDSKGPRTTCDSYKSWL